MGRLTWAARCWRVDGLVAAIVVLGAGAVLPKCAIWPTRGGGWQGLTEVGGAAQAPSFEITSVDLSETRLRVVVPGAEFRTELQGEVEYARITVPECGELDGVGLPALPIVACLLAIPECDDVQFSIIPTDSIDLPDVIPWPAPRHVVEYSPEGWPYVVEVFDPDEEFYGGAEGDSFYPGTAGSGSGIMHVRDQAVVRVELHPFRYNPVEDLLRVYTEYQVVCSHQGGTPAAPAGAGPLEGAAASLILGYPGDLPPVVVPLPASHHCI